MIYPATGDPEPISPAGIAIWHIKQACKWLVFAMPDEGVKEMTERLAEIAQAAYSDAAGGEGK